MHTKNIITAGEDLAAAGRALILVHGRGATAADGKSSDGVGILAAVPRALLLRETNLSIDDTQVLGVGMVLIPTEETRAEGLMERCLNSHDFHVLCWRDVPVCTEYLGEILAPRSGLRTPEDFRESLADTAADLDNKYGRTWRRKAYRPALTRLPGGFSGFSQNPVTRPELSISTTPQADGFGERNRAMDAIRSWVA